MEESRLRNIIRAGETERVEFKPGFNRDAMIALNAFANSEGGMVIIGVSDSGKILGADLFPETIQNWINELKSKTEPSIVPDVETCEIAGKTLVIFSTTEFPVKPVAIQGRYYRRVKNSNHQLSLSDISELYLKTFNSSWDYYLDDQHTLDDISMEKVRKFMLQIRKVSHDESEDVLRALKKYELIRNDKLTFAAYLLFVTDYSPMTAIQIGRFKSPTHIIDSLTVCTDLISEVDSVLSFLRKHFMTEYIITGEARRTERFDYPEDAVREIVLNMIVHRDYRDSGDSVIKIFDDRIEFFNPGKLDPGLTIEKLLSDNYTPKSRNKLISAMFKEAELVEKYGSGIKRIVDTCERHGGCFVIFTNEQHGFKVILRKYNSNTRMKVYELPKSSGINVAQSPRTKYNTTKKDTLKKISNSEEDTLKNKKDTLKKESIVKEDTLKTTNNIEDDTLKNDSDTLKNITTGERKIIELIKNDEKISQPEMAKILGISINTVKKYILKLRAKKVIEHIGPDKGGYWKIL